MYSLKILAFSLLFLPASTALAQDFGGQAAIDLGASMLNHVTVTAGTNPYLYGGNSSSTKKTKPVTTNTVRRTYTNNATLKKETVDELVRVTKAENPSLSQAVANNFGTGKYDYSSVYFGIVKGYGLRENDAVDAITANLVLGYMIVKNLQGNNGVTIAQVNGVKRQLGEKLTANKQLMAPGAMAKLGEYKKLLFVVLHSGWQSAIREQTLANYQQQIAAQFKTQYGLDLLNMNLSSNGFIAK